MSKEELEKSDRISELQDLHGSGPIPDEVEQKELIDRRRFFQGAAGVLAMMMLGSCSWQEFFQNNFRRMTKGEIEQTVERLKAEYKQKYGK
ncbi:MAG: hypothetical protein WB554_02790 [Desulfomonilaceae bacterium]